MTPRHEPRYNEAEIAAIGTLPERRRVPGDALPRGAEAQCPRCSATFPNDTIAYSHQYWTHGGVLTCLDPAGLGLVPDVRMWEGQERTVWCTPEGLAVTDRVREQTRPGVRKPRGTRQRHLGAPEGGE